MRHPFITRNTNNTPPPALCVLILSLLVFGVVGFCAPLAVDDLEFSGRHFQTFSEVLNFAFKYGNGRLLGNIGAVYLASSRLLRTVVRSIVISGCIVLLPMICKVKNTSIYWISFLSFTCLFSQTVGQLYSWSAGFQNYIPPIFLLLLAIFLIQKYEFMSSIGKIINLICLFLIGICAQLYVEHNTCVNILLAACALFYAYRKKAEIIIPAWFSLLASVIGGGLMLAIPHLGAGPDSPVFTYRHSIFDSGFTTPVKRLVLNAANLGNYISSFVFIFVALCVICLCLLFRKKKALNTKIMGYLSVGLLLPTTYFFFNTVICQNSWIGNTLGAILRYLLNIPFLILFFAAFLYTVYLCNKDVFPLILSLTILAAISTLPFIAVTQFGYRCMFLGYLFLVVAAILLLDDILDTFSDKSPDTHRFIKVLLVITSVSLAFCMVLSFINCGYIYGLLWKYFEDSYALGSTEMFYFDGNGSTAYYIYNEYGLYWYYDTPGDIKFHKISLEEWLNLYAQ